MTGKPKNETSELMGGSKAVAPVAPKNVSVGAQQYAPAPGTEAIRSEDVTFPRLKVLQGTSTEVESGGNRPGQLFNTITGETGSELEIIPLALIPSRVLFNPDDNKGAPLARTMDMTMCNHPEHGEEPVPIDECNHTKWHNNKPPVYTVVYNYPFLTPNDINQNALPTVISFMKSGITAALNMNTLVKGKIPPIPFWNYVWKLTTVSKKFKKGTAFVPVLKHLRETTEDERKWCEMVYRQCVAGKVIDVPVEQDGGGDD